MRAGQSRHARHAVIIVHGIGEQVPLETLKRVVRRSDTDDEAIVSSLHAMFSAPDRLTGHSYSRILKTTWNHRAAPGGALDREVAAIVNGIGAVSTVEVASSTDFFEFYWAPRFRDTKISDLASWALAILFRGRCKLTTTRLSGRKRPMWEAALAALVAAVASVAVFLQEQHGPSGDLTWARIPVTTLLGALAHGASVAVPFVLIVLSGMSFVRLVRGSGAPKAGPVVRALIAMLVGVVAFASLKWAPPGNPTETAWWVWSAAGVLSVAAVALSFSSRGGPIASARVALAVVPVIAITFSAASAGGHLHIPRVVAGLFGALVPTVTAAIALKFGDVPRYMVRSPRNVEETERLRTDAVQLLRRLHAARSSSGKFRYERIVVIGHSLGSVIAYDALRIYWAEVSPLLRFPAELEGADHAVTNALARERLDAMKAVERCGTQLAYAGLSRNMATTEPDRAAAATSRDGFRSQYRRSQTRLAESLAYPLPGSVAEPPDDAGGADPAVARWAVSDLVTAGSPLAHSELLMAPSLQDLVDDQVARIWPTCPPQPQRSEYEGGVDTLHYLVPSAGGPYPHQAALFASCRWTNLFFGRDGIGGPIAPVFGPGVQDRQVGLPGHGSTLELVSSHVHSSYWRPPARKSEHDGYLHSVETLRAIIARPPRLRIMATSPEAARCLSEKVIALAAVEPAAAKSWDQCWPNVEVEIRVPAKGETNSRPSDFGTSQFRVAVRRTVSTAELSSLGSLLQDTQLVSASSLALSPDMRPAPLRISSEGVIDDAAKPPTREPPR